MVTDALDLAEALSYHAVSLESGEDDNQYWTDWNQPITIGAQVFLSAPEMTVKLPVNDGLLNEQDGRVALPFVDDITDLGYRMTSGEPHADVTMKIYEIFEDPTGSAQKVVNVVFIGIIAKGRRNFEDRPDLIMLQALSEKGLISAASQGVQCNSQCSNTLGDRYCGIDITTNGVNSFLVTITDISEGELTVSGVPTGKDDFHFQLGNVSSQGLVINIQYWRNAANGDESKIQLMRQAPARWLGRLVRLVAGCSKSVEICRSRWDNEEKIRALGYGMPPYDPQFEGSPEEG